MVKDMRQVEWLKYYQLSAMTLHVRLGSMTLHLRVLLSAVYCCCSVNTCEAPVGSRLHMHVAMVAKVLKLLRTQQPKQQPHNCIFASTEKRCCCTAVAALLVVCAADASSAAAACALVTNSPMHHAGIFHGSR